MADNKANGVNPEPHAAEVAVPEEKALAVVAKKKSKTRRNRDGPNGLTVNSLTLLCKKAGITTRKQNVNMLIRATIYKLIENIVNQSVKSAQRREVRTIDVKDVANASSDLDAILA